MELSVNEANKKAVAGPVSFSKRYLLRLGSVRTLCFIVEAGLAFFIMPFIIRTLGNEMYGIWILIGTLLSYMGLLDLGIFSGVQRFISRGISKERGDEINIVVNTSLGIFALAGIVIIVISVFASGLVYLFTNDANLMLICQRIMLFMGIAFGVSFPLRVFEGILAGFMRHDIAAVSSSLAFIIQSCLIVLFLHSGFGILSMAVIASCTMLAQYMAQYFLARKVYKGLKLSSSFFRKNMVRELFGYGVYGFITQIAGMLRLRTGNIVIAAFLGLSGVTFYSVATRFLDYFDSLVVNALGFSTPLFSQIEGAGDLESLKKSFIGFTEASIFLCVFIGSCLIFYGHPFIIRWLGEEFETSYYILLLLIIPTTISLMLGSSTRLLFGISKHRFFSFIAIAEGVLIACCILVVTRSIGIYGVAIGAGAPLLVTRLVIVSIYVCRQIGLSLSQFYVKILSATLKALIPCLAYYLCIREFLSASYARLAIAVLGQAAVYLILGWFLFMDNKTRAKLREQFYSASPISQLRNKV